MLIQGTVVLSKGDIDRIYESEGESRERLQRWMVLGASLATLLQVPDTTEFIHSLAQLLEEYDYFFSNAAYQGMVMLSNQIGSGKDDSAQLASPRPVKPRVRKHMRHLDTRMVNFTLDPRQVVVSLCDVVACTFRRFMDPVCAEKPTLFDGILRLEQQISEHFIGKAARANSFQLATPSFLVHSSESASALSSQVT